MWSVFSLQLISGPLWIERDTEDLKNLETAILTNNFFSWPYHAVLSSRPYICLFCFPTNGPCRSLSHWAPGGQSPWLTVSKTNTPDWRLAPAKLPVSAVGRVHTISQRPCIPIVTHVTCFRLFIKVNGLLRMGISVLANQQRLAYISSMRTLDAV